MQSPLCVIVYSRAGCHLCEILLEEIQPLLRGRASLQVIDVDADANLTARYGERVPVVEVAGEFVCQYHLDRAALAAALTRATAPGGASPAA
ncbi:MAG: glutaredoxin family protein [Gammaproteobacteria bacterium]|nr:glutaredoxin family protein [Gammaproteobacteria bacterium]